MRNSYLRYIVHIRQGQNRLFGKIGIDLVLNAVNISIKYI